jgi:hypothetical protein
LLKWNYYIKINMNKFNKSNLLIPDVLNNYEISIKNKLFTLQLLKYNLSIF